MGNKRRSMSTPHWPAALWAISFLISHSVLVRAQTCTPQGSGGGEALDGSITTWTIPAQ